MKSRFGGRTKPSKSVIWKLVKQFREKGCMKVKKHIRQPNVVTPGKVDEVQEIMEASPKKYQMFSTTSSLFTNPRTLGELKEITNQ